MTLPTSSLLVLVEDADDDAFFFERALARTGLPITLVRLATGAEAVEYFNSMETGSRRDDPCPLLVLLDLKLPMYSGFDLLQWLHNRGFLSKMKVAVLSGSESEEDVNRARELGADDYFVKPIAAEMLRGVLLPLLTHSAEPGRPCLST